MYTLLYPKVDWNGTQTDDIEVLFSGYLVPTHAYWVAATQTNTMLFDLTVQVMSCSCGFGQFNCMITSSQVSVDLLC